MNSSSNPKSPFPRDTGRAGELARYGFLVIRNGREYLDIHFAEAVADLGTRNAKSLQGSAAAAAVSK